MASTFSYAQAAKGIAAPASQSKPASSSAVLTKDDTIEASPRSWAEDVESEGQADQSTTNREPRSITSTSNLVRESRSVDTSSVSSPDLGASSSSTVTKDDDVSSIPNTSSESTWDNKSQASTSVDQSAEPIEKTSEKVKKGKNTIVKPLKEAPPPAVNPWKIRADDSKAKVINAPLANGASQPLTKKSGLGAQEKITSRDSKNKGREENSQARKDAKARFADKDAKIGSSVLPTPPNRDQSSWPTPETAIDKDRKKAQEKIDKVEKDRKEGGSTGKHEWVKVPYTPSVVFNTPLPNAANTRRGGRPSARGGAQSNGRHTVLASHGAGQPEKDGSVSEPTNLEQAKLERPVGSNVQEPSLKEKRNGNVASTTSNGQVTVVNGDASVKAGAAASESDAHSKRVSESPHVPGQSSTFPRHYPNRPSKGRRGDFPAAGERRRNGEVSSSKDSTLDEHRSSVGTPIDVTGEPDRQGPTFPEGPNGHQPKQGRFSTFPGGRERGRGGRSARASYSNNQQFTNGHQPTHPSTISMGPHSPTTFNPGNTSFFSMSQGKYGRSGHRPQSIPIADAYRYPSYQAAPSGAPVQAYNMYDYSMMQPLCPMPIQYGVDYVALVAMITTQVEYYFSVDNLLKDMYLRRHMDSQGFVALDFIAGFNRIKTLSSDLDVVKFVCQQSGIIEYRVGEDGQDRLRRKDGWAQWVLNLDERDVTAQNEGPKELHQPRVPHPAGFEHPNSMQWAPLNTAKSYGNNGSFPPLEDDKRVSQDLMTADTTEDNDMTAGDAVDATIASSLPIENSTKA